MTAVEVWRPNWMERAACTDAPRDVFYPPPGGGSSHYRKAKAYCDACPVKGECLTWALEAEGLSDRTSRHGMFGGLTPRERQALRPPRICEICELPFRGDPRTPTCSERCKKIREARYQREWARNNRPERSPGSHGGKAMYAGGCRCSPCCRWKSAKSREERVRAEVRARQGATA